MSLIAAGRAAPAFELPSLDGRRRALPAEPRLGHTLAVFFKASCPTCQFALPFVQRFHNRFASPELALYGVSQDDAAETATFARRYDLGFPLLLDGDGYAASRAYGIVTVPTCVLVDGGGQVAFTTAGFVKKELEALADRLGEALAKDRSPVWRPDEPLPAIKPG